MELTKVSSMVVKPGLEALHMLIGARDGIGILLGYRTPRDPAIFLLELVDFVSTALWESLKLLALGDLNFHVEAEVSGPALEFLETMASLDMSQHVNSPTHYASVYSTIYPELV